MLRFGQLPIVKMHVPPGRADVCVSEQPAGVFDFL
jgi:hypothetical protein